MQVLGLEEGASDTLVRRQFRRLAQQVHPDKTHCFGAESAFKLISKAASNVTPSASAGAAGADDAHGDILLSMIGSLFFSASGAILHAVTHAAAPDLDAMHWLLLVCPASTQLADSHSTLIARALILRVADRFERH